MRWRQLPAPGGDVAPARSVCQRGLTGAVRAYRLLLSPWLGSNCRFEPTCSAYALQALDRHGAAAGSYLTLRRIARCHPWCPGGSDPVPPPLPSPPLQSHSAAHEKTFP